MLTRLFDFLFHRHVYNEPWKFLGQRLVKNDDGWGGNEKFCLNIYENTCNKCGDIIVKRFRA